MRGRPPADFFATLRDAGSTAFDKERGNDREVPPAYRTFRRRRRPTGSPEKCCSTKGFSVGSRQKPSFHPNPWARKSAGVVPGPDAESPNLNSGWMLDVKKL